MSDCSNHQRLINYLSKQSVDNLCLVLGLRELSDIIEEKYYNNQDGRLLVAFGELFNRNIQVYVYPIYDQKEEKLITARTLMVPDGIHFLYKHLVDGGQIVEIEDFDEDLLKIMPWNVLDSIRKGDKFWEQGVQMCIRDRTKHLHPKILKANSIQREN